MLLKIKALKLRPENPFTWASGWKSPIYCDNRKTLSYPNERNYIKWAFCKVITEQFPETEVIAGVATGAISWGALVADALGLPFVYIRSSAKDHGMQNLVEGDLPQNARVLVIEDLISTGGSSVKAVEAIQQAGAKVLSLIAVYTHGFEQAEKLFEEMEIPMQTLSCYEDVLSVAVDTGYVTADDVLMLQNWRRDSANWIPATNAGI